MKADTMVWLPIESAPKDGSMFLCWVDAVRYGEDDECVRHEVDVSDHDFCEWREDSVSGGYFSNMMGQIGDAQQITHWMPLPPPPTTPPPCGSEGKP